MSVLEIIFPQARAEVLRLLFADSSCELHLRELARLSDLAFGTLQAEVRKLSAAGLLNSRRDGNRLYFRANPEHPIFPELHGLALKTTGLREQLIAALNGLDGVELAFVFGSVADGNEGAGSDVDLMVIGSAGLRSLAPRLRPVAQRIGREINPHIVSPSSFTEKAKVGDAFITSVLTGPKLWIKGGADELGELD